MERFCPTCRAETPLPFCPSDGSRTVMPTMGAAPVVPDSNLLGGQYRLERTLGRGGFGAVYRAVNMRLDQVVAVKILQIDPRQPRGEQVARFRREALLASKLRHPNTIRVQDYGETADGDLYLVMEYLEGQSLLDVVKRDAPVAPSRVCTIVRQVLGALSEAHSNEIVHRDIKPANVFITHHQGISDFVKLLDFGIAKPVSSTMSEAMEEVTRTGMFMGTPKYMAPELWEPTGRATPASDLYAVGILTFELLTGKPPFVAEGLLGIGRLHCEAPTPPLPARLRGEPTDLVSRFVQRCLAKEPELRFASAAEAQKALLDAPVVPRTVVSMHAVSSSAPAAPASQPRTGSAVGPASPSRRPTETGATPRIPKAPPVREPASAAGRCASAEVKGVKPRAVIDMPAVAVAADGRPVLTRDVHDEGTQRMSFADGAGRGKTRGGSKRRWLAAGVVAVALIGGAVWYTGRVPDAAPSAMQAPVAPPPAAARARPQLALAPMAPVPTPAVVQTGGGVVLGAPSSDEERRERRERATEFATAIPTAATVVAAEVAAAPEPTATPDVPATVIVSVSSEPAATVHVGKRQVCAKTPCEVAIDAPGETTLLFRAKGHAPVNRALRIERGEIPRPVAVALKKLERITPPTPAPSAPNVEIMD
jgi:serine/threonine protein kinase